MRYRKIDPKIWNDEKFRGLSDRGKLAFLFVLTHPHLTSLGAMRATLDGLAAELGWPAKQFRDAIGEAIRHGMVEVAEDAAYVGLPNFLRYNEPEGPNSVTRAWVEALDLIPECGHKHRLKARCRAYLDAKSDAFRKAIGDAIWHAFAMPCPIPEQEPEQEQEQEQELGGGESERGNQDAPAAKPPSPTLELSGNGARSAAATFRIPDSVVQALNRAPRLGSAPRLRDPAFWQAELRANPGVNLAAEVLKAEAWLTANQHRAPRKDLARFLHNWLVRAERDEA